MADPLPPSFLEPSSQLHWRRMGSGPPLVLLHGFTGSARAWPSSILDGLGASHTLLLPDLPGHGESPLGPHRGGSLFRQTVDRLRRGVGTLIDEPAIWMGYSMGGRLALAVALERRGTNGREHEVRGLVLESASPGLEDPDEARRREAADATLAQRIRDEGMEWFVDHWLAQPLFRSQARLPPLAREEERRRRLDQTPEALAAALAGLSTGGQPSYWAALHELSAPVLLVTGSEDSKFTGLAERMEERFPAARRVVVAGAGHCVHLEAPHEWLGAVQPFLAGLLRPPP